MAKQYTFEGKTYTVPDDTTPEEFQLHLEGQKFQPSVAKLSPETNPQAAPYVGRLVANSLPVAGSFFGPEGTLAGLTVSGLLKSAKPDLFGEAPSTEGLPVVGDMLKNLLINNVIPAGIGKAVGAVTKPLPELIANSPLARLPGVRNGATKEMTQQITNKFAQPESQILESGAKGASDQYGQLSEHLENVKASVPKGPFRVNGQLQETHPAVQQALEDLSNVFGTKNKVGRALVNLNKEIEAGTDIAKSQTYKDIANTALSDITHVQNWKLAAGEKGIQDLALNKLLTGGWKESEGTLNAAKILDELGRKNKEIYSEAIDPAVMDQFKGLVGEIQAQQAGHGTADAIVKWSKGHLLWTLGGFHLGMGPVGLAATGVNITNKMLSRAMENPETAKAVVAAMRTPAGAPQASMLQNVLVNTFKGLADLGTVPEK